MASLHAGQRGWPPRACPSLEPFPPQIQTPLPDSPELWTQAKHGKALVQGGEPSSAFCRRSWSPGPRTSAETLEFFNLKPKVHSPSLSFLSFIHSWQTAHSLLPPRSPLSCRRHFGPLQACEGSFQISLSDRWRGQSQDSPTSFLISWLEVVGAVRRKRPAIRRAAVTLGQSGAGGGAGGAGRGTSAGGGMWPPLG